MFACSCVADVTALYEVEKIPHGKKFFEQFEHYRTTNAAYGEATPLAFDALYAPRQCPSPPFLGRRSGHMDVRDPKSKLGLWSNYAINEGKATNGRYDHYHSKLREFSKRNQEATNCNRC